MYPRTGFTNLSRLRHNRFFRQEQLYLLWGNREGLVKLSQLSYWRNLVQYPRRQLLRHTHGRWKDREIVLPLFSNRRIKRRGLLLPLAFSRFPPFSLKRTWKAHPLEIELRRLRRRLYLFDGVRAYAENLNYAFAIWGLRIRFFLLRHLHYLFLRN